MAFVSVTRLRVRSAWTLPAFFWLAGRSYTQARKAEGCIAASLRQAPNRVFWTISLWREEAAMAAYRASGVHRRAMPKLAGWCDEASVAHWTQAGEALPDWSAAEAKMREIGRLSKVRRPSPAHAAGSAVG